MGQYHKPVNLDKKQFLHPHKLGDGLKLLEQAWTGQGTCSAVMLLLACSNGRGGGDAQSDDELIGSWAGDRIAWIGDYAEPNDIPGFNAEEIYSACDDDGEYEDISDQLIPILEREFEVVFVPVSEHMNQRFELDRIEGYRGSHGLGDRHIMLGDHEYHSSHVIERLKAFFKTHSYYEVKNVTVEDLGLTPITFTA